MRHNKIKTLILAGLITTCAVFPAFARNRLLIEGYQGKDNKERLSN